MDEVFGFLTVIDTFKGSDRSWDVRCRCKCVCGREVVVLRSSLRSGATKSCGCMSNALRSKALQKVNKYDTKGDVTYGYATNDGTQFTIDTDDLDLVKDFGWMRAGTGYLVHRSGNKMLLLHRMVTGAGDGLVVDHLNHDKTDNRKSNLKVCTQKENCRNKKDIPKGIFEVKRGSRTYFIVELRGYRGCFKNYSDAKALRDKILVEEYGIDESFL